MVLPRAHEGRARGRRNVGCGSEPERDADLAGDNAEPQPARIVGISLAPTISREALEAIFGLAAKYDLVLFDTRSRRVHLPLEAMADYASATFWPAGAIQAAVAGGIGAVLAVGAWLLGIPVLSGLLVVVGGFMVVMAVYTFIHEGRKAAGARRTGGESPPRG